MKVLMGLFVVLLAGCGLPQRHVSILAATDTMEVVAYPPDLRGAYMLSRPGMKLCAEPVPDVALASTSQLTGQLSALSASGQKIDATAAANFATTVAELSGRTQVVLLARELLFRACEFSMNYPDADQGIALKMYERAADLVQALGQAEVNRAKADLAGKEAALLRRTGEILDAGEVKP